MKKKILALTIIPMEVTAIILAIVSVLIVGQSMTEETEKQLAISANTISEEYYLVDSTEKLQDFIIDFKKDNDIDVVVFKDRKQVVTTYDDYDMNMDYQIYKVVNKGDIYFHTNVKLNGESYITYFLPIMEDGKYVGSIMAAKPLLYLNQMVAGVICRILLCSILVTTFTFVIASAFVRALTKKLDNINNLVSNMANNDLSVEYDKYSFERDEIEAIFNEGVNLTKQLNSIIDNTKLTASDLKSIVSMMRESIEYTSSTSNEIVKAIEDVASSSYLQAEETTSASLKVSDIASELSKIETNAGELDNVAKVMKQVKDSAMDTVTGLQTANEEIVNDVNSTNDQVNITSESVAQIKKQ